MYASAWRARMAATAGCALFPRSARLIEPAVAAGVRVDRVVRAEAFSKRAGEQLANTIIVVDDAQERRSSG